MDLNLGDKVALVTGASQGIGLAVARQLAHEGAFVVINGRDRGRLEAAASAFPEGRVGMAPGDVGIATEVVRVVEQARGHRGRIDILVNNAGATPAGRLEDVSDEDWHRSLELKLLGYVRCARAVLPEMRARRWGRIVNVIGSAGYQPRATYIAGSAINAALLSLTKGLAADAAPDGVLVNGINPGPIRTARWLGQLEHRARLEGTTKDALEAWAERNTPVRRVGRPEDIASVVSFLCSEHAAFVSGALIDVDGGSRVGI